MLTTIELFAGIAGFSSPHTRPLALVEKEPTCRAVLRRHHSHALILDDVRTVGAHNLPWANIIKFGFPCQDLSVAGNRAGLTGARSGLFYEATRIVHELQPDFAIWENVPGLLSSGAGRDFLAVLTELDRIGFAGGWTTVDAQFFGVAQRRQRVFGVFARRDIGAARCAEILSLAARLPWNLAPGRRTRKNVAGTIAAGAHPGSYNGQDAYTGQLIPFDTTQITSASNYSTPRAGNPCHPLSATAHAPAIAQSNRGRDTGDTFETLRAGSHGALPMVASAQSASHGGADDNDAQAGGGPQYGEILEDGNCYTLNCTEVHAVGSTFGVRRLTPRERERLQGFEDDWTAWGMDEQGRRVEMSDSVRYRMLGNAVCRKVSAWIDSQLVSVL